MLLLSRYDWIRFFMLYYISLALEYIEHSSQSKRTWVNILDTISLEINKTNTNEDIS